MPDVGTPQATWRDDPEVQALLRESFGRGEYAMDLAVAADRRIQAARLRTKIEALPPHVNPMHLSDATALNRSDVLAVLDDVLGGDS